MTGTLRLLAFARATAPWNMAVDEAVLESVAVGEAPPTLRLYGWRGRWLSVGMAQPIAQVDRAACAAAGVRIVRRASGGTAVLHDDQVGWSLTVPEGHPLAIPDIVASYAAHAAITLEALARLGIEARPIEPACARAPLPEPELALACFGGLAPHEIVVGDPPRKLVGWGQVRRRGVVMHHAVTSLHFDAAALAALLVANCPRLAAALERRVIGLDEAAGRPVAPSEIALEYGPGEPGELTPNERRRARELVHTKYASDDWTARR